MFIGVVNLPTALTLFGVLLGLAAVGFAQGGQVSWAVICLMYSGLCDLFDGVLARRMALSDEERAFGVQIDTVADMASFGVVPAVVLLLLGSHAYPALAVYVLCAAIRLAWFNANTASTDAPITHYTGLPVTYAALVLPLVLMVSTDATQITRPWLVQAALWALAIAFVAKWPVPKPRGAAYLFFVLLAVGLTVYWCVR